ncbi:MAG: hypothetical protein RMH75_07505 [Archaeoglobaceae archaeon]|nr:hypothetical protein [Archaeoglobaceae archaeon]MDW7990485.1 hypothetical protein [Archaeoglobaceae archaeon]
MDSTVSFKKMLGFIAINYSHFVDTGAFLREVENYLSITEALVGDKYRSTLDELWKEWGEAVEFYNVSAGWKDTWKKCAILRAKLFEIMVKENLLHVTLEMLNIDKIQFKEVEK